MLIRALHNESAADANRASPAVVPLRGTARELRDRGPSPVDEPAAFYRRYAAYVARIVIRLHAVDEDLDDLVHDVFVSAFAQADKLRDLGAARGWLATITVRTVRRKLHKARLRRMLWLAEEVPLQVEAPGASPEQLMQLQEVYRSLEQLPVNDALAWKLRYVEGQRLQEVADHLGCSLATAKRWIARASAHLEVNLGG